MTDRTQNRLHFSGFDLKLIAIVTMFIDHSAVSTLERMLYDTDRLNGNWYSWYMVYILLRMIGRMAFPIYCYLLTEGFHYTRNRWKYAARLAVFALISEVPFDAALFNSWYDPDYNNVFFTLLLGLLCLMILDLPRKKIRQLQQNAAGTDPGIGIRILYGFLAFAGCAALMYVAEAVLHTDYGAVGVMTIIVMDRLRERKELAFLMGVLVLGLGSSPLEFAALLMLIPIHFYDGTRGRQVNKYLFYAFYPAHLTILAIVSYLMGLGI